MSYLRIPAFLFVFAFVIAIFQGCSFYNLDERPKWAYLDEEGTVIRDTKYPPEFYMTFLGEGRANSPQEARKLAERDALRQLSETIQSRIKSEMNVETSMIKKAGIYSKEVRYNEIINVTSESEIPNFTIKDAWDIGIDHERRSVVYVLGVFDIYKATETVSEKCRNILKDSKIQWSKIQKLYEAKKPGDLALLLNHMVSNFELARYNFPVYYFLGGSTAYDEVSEISRIKLDFEELISTSLSRLTYSTDEELNFVRGKSKDLKIKICVPFDDEKMVMSSSKFNVKTEAFTKVITSDSEGFLTIPMPVAHKLKSGSKTLNISLWLQNEKTKPEPEISKIEKKCSFNITYSLNPDYIQAQGYFSQGETNIKEKKWESAISAFEKSKLFIWDIRNWMKIPENRIHFCNYMINWENGTYCLSSKEYESAVKYFEVCKSEAQSGDYQDEYAKADESWREAVYLNAKEQIITGNETSRDFALSRLYMVPGSFKRSEIPVLISNIKKKLPCPVCRFSGKCPDCEGDGKILKTCKTCSGQGIVKEKCKVCDGTGREECPECNGEDHTWIRCKNCNALGKVKCPKCNGFGETRHRCQKCNGRGSYEVVINGQKRLMKCNNCNRKGIVIERCNNCNGKGTIDCPVCNRGYGSKPGYEKKDCPLCTNGTIPCRNRDCRNGWLSETCPECNGRRQIYYPCNRCHGTGICPHCHGIAHRP